MFEVDKENTIHLTRGDTAPLIFQYENADGTPYEMRDGDKITFTVRGKKPESEVYIKKEVTGTNKVTIAPEDTAGMSFGKKYFYDAQLTTAEGFVGTIGSYEMEILREESF